MILKTKSRSITIRISYQSTGSIVHGLPRLSSVVFLQQAEATDPLTVILLRLNPEPFDSAVDGSLDANSATHCDSLLVSFSTGSIIARIGRVVKCCKKTTVVFKQQLPLLAMVEVIKKIIIVNINDPRYINRKIFG